MNQKFSTMTVFFFTDKKLVQFLNIFKIALVSVFFLLEQNFPNMPNRCKHIFSTIFKKNIAYFKI